MHPKSAICRLFRTPINSSASHLEELKRTNLIREIPQEPTSFIKLNSCLVGHNAEVARPEGIVRLDYEPELVFVIGKRALGVKKKDAFDYVAGVTILNDLTCRDLQQRRDRDSGQARTSPVSGRSGLNW